ncbi:hypothetical protein C0T31_04640 [Dysgonamonadaceae bacterium]|nr:hypothetical protein C0T31_04640 [Dysgonamonadaceae bacterium]
MKHIFVVHSPITYLSSLGVILTENLDLSDVLIISNGFNVKGPVKINIVNIAVNRTFSPSSMVHNLKLFYDRGYSLNITINNFVRNEKFIAYVSVFNYLERFTVIHPNCINFNFIEEGVESYHTSHSLSHYAISYKANFNFKKGFRGLIDRIKKCIRTFGITEAIAAIPIFSIAYRHDESKTFYCYSNKAYPFAANKKLLNFNSIKNVFYSQDYSQNSEISEYCIWIGGCDTFENNQLYDEFLNKYLLKFLKKESINKLLIRFHPRETKKQRLTLTNFLDENKIDHLPIPDETIMELFLLNFPKTICLGLNSSLLLYSSYMGHKSISFGDQINKQKNSRYPVYREYVEFLDESYFL